jgi:Arc/MetJ family transcription regulator
MARTNIVLDDKLIAEVMTLTGATTKREAIHISLEAFVKRAARQKILRHRAAGTWEGDLAQLREDNAR